MQQFQIS